jgi:hypothetical protein
MSINNITITFDLDEYTIQIVNGDFCIWTGDQRVDPDVVLRVAELRRILASIDMLTPRSAI